MLIDPETALLKDIDEFLYGASDHIGLQFGNSFDMRSSFDDDTLDDVILNIKLIVDSCLLEVENYNLMAVRQRISLAQSLRDRDLTNLAESHLDEDTRSKVLAAFTEMQPEISLARSYNPREPYEPINSSDLDGGKGKKTKKKKYKTKKRFLYNPDNPKKSFDVYIDSDPSYTIPIKYKTISDVKNTIKKLERLYKNGKYPHKRIWQVGMIMYVRLKVVKDKKPKEFKLSERYFKHLGKRTKIKGEKERKKFSFKI